MHNQVLLFATIVATLQRMFICVVRGVALSNVFCALRFIFRLEELAEATKEKRTFGTGPRVCFLQLVSQRHKLHCTRDCV